MHGGGTIRGDTPEMIVRALRASSYHACASEQAFMEELSGRCRFYNGAIISTYDRENFVEDLIHNGFLKEIDPAAAPENIVPFEQPQEEK
jgi:hypothetical protein